MICKKAAHRTCPARLWKVMLPKFSETTLCFVSASCGAGADRDVLKSSGAYSMRSTVISGQSVGWKLEASHHRLQSETYSGLVTPRHMPTCAAAVGASWRQLAWLMPGCAQLSESSKASIRARMTCRHSCLSGSGPHRDPKELRWHMRPLHGGDPHVSEPGMFAHCRHSGPSYERMRVVQPNSVRGRCQPSGKRLLIFPCIDPPWQNGGHKQMVKNPTFRPAS